MKKLLTLVLVTLAVLLMSSCSSTKVTTAVTTGQTTTTIAEPTIKTVVETTVETKIIIESRLFKEEIIDDSKSTVKKTIETTETSADTTTETAVVDKRQPTGDGGRLPFQIGDTVLGAAIEINGKTFLNRIIKDAPMAGIVVSGAIWPWESEMLGLTIVSNDEILAPVSTVPAETTTVETTVPTETTTETTATTVEKVRTPTGVGQSLSFQAGDTVVGWSAVINGQTVEDENGVGIVIYNSPYSGVINDGVINPWPDEITNQTVITP